MFEKTMSSHCSNNPGALTTFYKPIHSNNHEIIKDIIQNHKNLLSLPDNKVKLDNIKAILLYHSISIAPNMKVADLKDLLLQHCNTTMTMPITFVSDCNIENYTVAPEREQSSKYDQNTSVHVPVTFINDSMINLVKTEEQKDGNYPETKGAKRADLTPNKEGYTPERHPIKKHKVEAKDTKKINKIVTTKQSKFKSFREMIDASPSSAFNSSGSDSDDFEQAFQPLNCLAEQPKSKSFKEMIDAIHKSTINSSDSDDDSTLGYQPLNNPDFYFDTLDEPTESEQLYIREKSYMSDSFDYSHEFQMVKTQELWEYKEFDRSQTPKYGNKHDHLEQVRRFILKNGFQEPIVISCDLQSGKAYITEGNHRLWVALKEEIPFIPCRVIPHWLPPNGSYKKLDIDFSKFKSKELILPEHLGLTVAQT